MKLIWKFNLVLLGVFIIGFVAAGYVSKRMLMESARDEVLQHARLMMEAALASRTYTNTQIKPLLVEQLKTEFLPQIGAGLRRHRAVQRPAQDLQRLHLQGSHAQSVQSARSRERLGSRRRPDVPQHARRPPKSSASATRRPGARFTSPGRSRSRARPASNATAPSTWRPRRCSTSTAAPTASAGK